MNGTGYYHIYNKSIDNLQVFNTSSNIQRFLTTLWYYRSQNVPFSLSIFLSNNIDHQTRSSFAELLNDPHSFHVSILSFCLMPNHFHILLRENNPNGTRIFMSNVTNSFTRYFNTKNDRKGPIFLRPFKRRAIYTEECFLHVSRYIHLNPITSKLVQDSAELEILESSSLKDYKQNNPRSTLIEDRSLLLHYFDNSYKKYLEFVINNANHQRTLHLVKYR